LKRLAVLPFFRNKAPAVGDDLLLRIQLSKALFQLGQ